MRQRNRKDVPSADGREIRAAPPWIILLGSLMLGLAGCSHQDFGRPIMGAMTDAVGVEHRPTNEVPERLLAEAALRAERLAQVLAVWVSDTNAARRDYTIGPNDVLEVVIPSLESPDQVAKLIRSVSADETIALPWIGLVKTGGMNRSALEARIRAAYADRYLKDPQVGVTVTEYRSAPIVLTGAVNRPGIYYLRHNQSSLLEVLTEANGLNAEAGDEVIVLRGGGGPIPLVAGPAEPGAPEAEASTNRFGAGPTKSIVVDLRQLVDEGDLRQNIWVKSGDVISVRTRERGYIYVLGYVQRPGAVSAPAEGTVNALQVVAMSGGLTATARAENSFLIRQSEDGQTVLPVDLTKLARGTRSPVYLQAGDTLVVGSSFLARLGEIMKPSVGAGVSYAPLP